MPSSTTFFVLLLLLFGSSHLTSQALTALFHRLLRSHAASVRMLAILFLPGVVLHELAHAIMAKMLLVPVGHMEFMPQIDEDRVKLGSVQIGKTDPLRRMLIGLAPVVFGLVVLFALLYFFLPRQFIMSQDVVLQSVLLLYGVFVIGNTMFSSKRDLEGSASFAIALIIVGVMLYFAGIRIPPETVVYLSSEQVQSLFYAGNIFLAVPLGINLVVIFFVRVIFGIR
jgi:hypothetical protein